MNLFLVWQDRALSVYIKDIVCCVLWWPDDGATCK